MIVNYPLTHKWKEMDFLNVKEKDLYELLL